MERPDLLVRLTRTLARLPSPEPFPLRLCHAVVEVVEARAGAIALGLSTPDRTLLCATSELAARFEDAQDLTHEGPSLEALRTGRSVLSSTFDDRRRRWPQLADAVSGFPAGVVRAFPMRPSTAVIGVLTVHHDPASAAPSSLPELQFLADAVGAAIIGHLPEPEQPSALWTERDRVSQAAGMVVAQLDVDPADALAILRAHAFAQETTVVEISRRVVARQLDFSGPDGGAR